MGKYTYEQLQPIVAESRSITDVCRKLGKSPNSGGARRYFLKIIDAFGLDRGHFTSKRETYTRYTRDVLEPIVKESVSIAEVCRKLGLSDTGGSSHAYVSRQIDLLDLDRTHFKGQRSNSGGRFRGGTVKVSVSDILTKGRRGAYKEPIHRLRQAMTDSGVPYICNWCGTPPEWNGKPLTIQVDHINGDSVDNRLENLRFLCPNCHSQTDTFAGNKRKRKGV